MDKGVLREQMKKKRSELPEKDYHQLSEIICQKVLKHLLFQEAQSIGVYMSMHKEVDTRKVIETALIQRKTVAIPKLRDSLFEHVKISSLKDIITDNIPQPIGAEVINPVECVIVPGLAFDRRGFRVGYGKGGYDRMLAESESPSIGLAFDFQLVKEIPTEEHDMPVDYIITEKEVISTLLYRGYDHDEE